MSYQDDDGETTDILNEHDLTEAIHYFHVGADDNASTNGSILSGYSGRISRKITLRISVAVEYDGPSLSDTGSLVSLEEYQKRDSLSLSDVIAAGDPYAYHDEPDDDAVTISSHDTSSRMNNANNTHGFPYRPSQRDIATRFSEALSIEEEDAAEISLSESSYPGQRTSSSQLHAESAETPPTSRDHGLAPSSLHKSPSFVEPGSDKVFERLRQMDSDPFAVSQQSLPLDANERGAQWLRDQTDRAAWLGSTTNIITPMPSSNTLRTKAENFPPRTSPPPSSGVSSVAPPPHHFASDSDFDAASSSMGGDLELQKDEKGKYYFNYTSDSSSHGDHAESSVGNDASSLPKYTRDAAPQQPPPTSFHPPTAPPVTAMQTQTPGAGPSGANLAKRVSQVSHITESAESRASGGGERSSHRPAAARASASASRLGKLPESHTESGDLSPETLQAILESDSRSGPDLVTDCSSCGDILDSFRYVCTSCGEKTPQTREELVQSRALRAAEAGGEGIVTSSDGRPLHDPFVDPEHGHDRESDFGLRLYEEANATNGSALHMGEEEDITDIQSESSFSATSSWTSSRDPSSPQHSPVHEASGASGWQGLFKGAAPDRGPGPSGGPSGEIPMQSFRSKLKKGLKLGLTGSTGGMVLTKHPGLTVKGKSLPPLPPGIPAQPSFPPSTPFTNSPATDGGYSHQYPPPPSHPAHPHYYEQHGGYQNHPFPHHPHPAHSHSTPPRHPLHPHLHPHSHRSATSPTSATPTPPHFTHRPEVVITTRSISSRSDSSGKSRADSNHSGSSRSNSASAMSASASVVSAPTTVEAGYELCSKCIATAGVIHAEEVLSGGSTAATPTATSAMAMSIAPRSPASTSFGGSGGPPHSMSSSSLGSGSSMFENSGGARGYSPSNTTLSAGASLASLQQPEWGMPNGGGGTSPVQAMGPNPGAPPAPRRPKRKVQIRHAYLEKFWGPGGWQDVELDDEVSCSICNKPLQHERYKCISCEQFNLCRAHYSQVHEIHPSHAFVAVPDKEAVIPPQALITNADEEKSMVHPGVRCNHCLQEIVGARFHCAQCEDVDICANCESAGLPGNLTSPDGGHDSSHIMIKIPLPLATAEVRMASERARALLSGRDAPAIAVGDGARGPRPRANSLESTYQKTVIGAPRSATINKDHHILCRSCNKSIIGLRYQCASCPSLPTAYNLCEDCEGISFTVHDPMHIFIKITRPVDRPIESAAPLLPPIYDIPAGQDRDGNHYGEDFKAYLQGVPHTSAFCDRCVEPIYGEWFRCANCDADFCEDCEQLKVHDSTHVFLVIKSTLDMGKFKRAVDLDNENRQVGVLKHLVHLHAS